MPERTSVLLYTQTACLIGICRYCQLPRCFVSFRTCQCSGSFSSKYLVKVK